MGFPLDPRSLQRLIGVHTDLVRVVKAAAKASPLTFRVTEGVRTQARQAELVAAGASWTMKSRHLTGHAVDLVAVVGTQIRWDWPLYQRLADAMFEAAKAESVALEWGGSWRKQRDGPHFQLPWKDYPAR